jgi:hypothetical protein
MGILTLFVAWRSVSRFVPGHIVPERNDNLLDFYFVIIEVKTSTVQTLNLQKIFFSIYSLNLENYY